MFEHHKIDYVEFSLPDPDATRSFFAPAFGWHFEEFGDYLTFQGAGLDGGIYRSDQLGRADSGGPLLVFYSLEIAGSERLVCQHGATISQPCFSFPGGCRFHFIEPAGNEFAVWSDLQQIADDRLPDDRLPDDRLPDDRLPDDRLPDDRLVGAANLS